MKNVFKLVTGFFVLIFAVSIYCATAYSQAGDHTATGTVEAIEADTLTIKLPDNTTLTLQTPDYSSYSLDGNKTEKDQIKPGMAVDVRYYVMEDDNSLTHLNATSNTQE